MNDKKIKKIMRQFKEEIPLPPKIVKVIPDEIEKPYISEDKYYVSGKDYLNTPDYDKYKELWFKSHSVYPRFPFEFTKGNILDLNKTVSWNKAGYNRLLDEASVIYYKKKQAEKEFFKENNINNSREIDKYKEHVLSAFRHLAYNINKSVMPHTYLLRGEDLIVRLGAQKMSLVQYLDLGLDTNLLRKGGLIISNKPIYKLARTILYKANKKSYKG